jgi:HD-GYP domain-containing protein (c-di-GMP phosphodiesterase class II)
MSLAAPVPNPDQPEQALLHRGYVLEEQVLARLRDRGVCTIYIDFPALDFLDRHLAAEASPERQQLVADIKNTFVQSQRDSAGGMPFHQYTAGIKSMVETLLTQGPHRFYLDQMARLGGLAVQHSAAVAHLSLLLGLRLENYLIEQRKRLPVSRARDVVNLGVGAILHDLGKTRMPKDACDLYELTAKDPEQKKAWSEHMRLGYEMIHNGVEPTAAAAVLHHHQHFDGSGLPAPAGSDGAKAAMVGQQIHIFARIVMVADLFDRLVHAPGSNKRRTNLEALHDLHTRYAAWCDPVIVNALMTVAPPFPPGTRVTLADGSEAIVTGMDPAAGYRPVVQRFNGEGMELDNQRIDLKDAGTPAITRISELEVAPLLPQRTAA